MQRILKPTYNTLEFIDYFVNLFGPNLENVIEFGTLNKDGGNDIDLMMCLKKFDRASYDLIYNKKEEINNFIYKKVGIALLPSEVLTSYTSCDYHNFEIARHGRLLYGNELQYLVLSEYQHVEKMFFQVGKNLTNLRGRLSDDKVMEIMRKSPKFLRETLKLELWIKKGLLQKKLGKYLSKKEFSEINSFQLPDLGKSPSLEDARMALYDANCRVKKEIDKYFTNKND